MIIDRLKLPETGVDFLLNILEVSVQLTTGVQITNLDSQKITLKTGKPGNLWLVC